MINRFGVIEAHAGSQAVRLIVDGVPRPLGRTLHRKVQWTSTHADHVRRAVVLEPRGHADMLAAMLTEPVSPDAHAGLVFMDAGGYPPLSGPGVIAAATIAAERELFFSRDHQAEGGMHLVFDTAAGTAHAHVRLDARAGARRADSVAFSNVPSFVHTPAYPVRMGSRELRVDIAFGGSFYAIVDTEAIGIALRPERLPELRRLGWSIREAVNASYAVEHPREPALNGVAGVVFTGPPEDPEAHLRSLVVTGDAVDRSPSGTGTSAVMAVLDAMGLLPDDHTFVHESLTGAIFRGRALKRTQVGDFPALVPEIVGSAWITGEHTFLVDDDDPLREGFQLAPCPR